MKMLDEELSSILSEHHLKSTEKRKSVLRLFYSFDHALSSKMIEKELGEIDRVTLYRLLNSFEEKGIIHKVTNNLGESFYAKCSSCKHNHHHDDHAHFHCEECKKVYCLDHVQATDIEVPAGFKSNYMNLAVYGVCDKCLANG